MNIGGKQRYQIIYSALQTEGQGKEVPSVQATGPGTGVCAHHHRGVVRHTPGTIRQVSGASSTE